ncbi:MAG TPA: PAS domain S-box protein, partial [Candidatus Binatus sp.]|nr:PAS domain S-box protein [Candidatus Binatus sp.]
MNPPLRILHLEDSAQDAELVKTRLSGEGVDCEILLIDSREAYVSALDRGGFDLILADYSPASLDGLSALRIAKEKWPETPFILVSSVMGEQTAVECLKLGATDYVLKQHLSRLVPCIKRALQEAKYLRARKIAEAQLHVQSAALEAAANAIVITDREGRITWVNPAFSKLTGYSAQEAIGQNPRLLKSTVHDHHFYEALWKTILAGEVWSGEMVNRRKDGTLYSEEQSITPVKNAEGKISHFIAIKQDISERKQVEQALHARDVAEASNRLKSEFLANMSHELRTPLNAIIGFSQMMHDGRLGPVSEAHIEFLGDILNSADHLLQLINDVLDLAKIEAGRIVLQAEPVDLQQLIVEACDIVRGMAAKKRLEIETSIDPAVLSVCLDPGKLKQVLYNFLSNAVKFTPDGGRITVRARPESPEEFRIEIEDTGIGINSDDVARLFVEFQQLDASSTKQYPGTGLGLALSKKIIEAQGGRVGVD